MSFQGWPAEALEFYEGLEADNSKAYWTAHKAVYEEMVLGPMAELLEELAPEFGEPKIFRPYRDIRFSKDKSPYKTHIGAIIGDGYIQLSANGLAAGSGMYGMAPDQLDRYRQAVAGDKTGEELERVISGIERQEIAVHGHDVLKTAPRGYPGRPPADRAAALQGRGGLEGVAGRGLARDAGRPSSAWPGSWPPASRSAPGWTRTWARPRTGRPGR